MNVYTHFRYVQSARTKKCDKKDEKETCESSACCSPLTQLAMPDGGESWSTEQ